MRVDFQLPKGIERSSGMVTIDDAKHAARDSMLLMPALTATLLLHVVCLQVAHCADVAPVSQPGTSFECPADTEFNPAKAMVEEPSEKKCCKVRAMYSFRVISEEGGNRVGNSPVIDAVCEQCRSGFGRVLINSKKNCIRNFRRWRLAATCCLSASPASGLLVLRTASLTPRRPTPSHPAPGGAAW